MKCQVYLLFKYNQGWIFTVRRSVLTLLFMAPVSVIKNIEET